MSIAKTARLLAGASTLVIGGLLAATPAHAFDQVNWSWDATLTETITKDVTVTIDAVPTGMVMIEGIQAQIGDVNARSVVSGITNTQPLTEGGLVDLGTRDVTFQYGIGGGLLENGNQSPEVTAANVDEVDQLPNINGTVTATIDLGQVEVAATTAVDAVVELPSVSSAATAVGNNTSIDSEVAVQLHNGQFLLGDGNSGEGSPQLASFGTQNTNLTIAAALGVLALSGDLVKAEVKAVSKVSDILNASVDSTATAVGNNLSVEVAPVSAGDGLVIGDVMQFAYANVSAKSSVKDVMLNNYANLGAPLGRAIVSSTATAVGNNASVTVKTPVVVAP